LPTFAVAQSERSLRAPAVPARSNAQTARNSRASSGGTLEGYDYLGLGTVVRRTHSQPGVDLTYVKLTGESDGSAGDKYTGLDSFGRVVDQRWVNGSGTSVDRYQYGYDRNSIRTYRDNLVNTALGEVYANDGLNQMTSFTRGTLDGTKTGVTGSPARTQAFDLDALGNFESVTTNGTAQTRTHDKQNQVTGVTGATTPTYDAEGNLTKDSAGQQYVYDAWDQLVAVKNSGGTTIAAYEYDGTRRRVQATAGGTTTDLYYSADWQVVEERVGSAVAGQYVWSPVYVDALVLRDRDTDANGTLDERLWALQDGNWNVTALVNGSGTVVERYAYDPFGAATVLDGSWGSRSASSYGWEYRFQGLRADLVTGLYNARYRDLHPVMGRPLERDPLGYAAGDVNQYRWEGNTPASAVDPSGLWMSLSKTIANDWDKNAPSDMKPQVKTWKETRGYWDYWQDWFADNVSGEIPPPPGIVGDIPLVGDTWNMFHYHLTTARRREDYERCVDLCRNGLGAIDTTDADSWYGFKLSTLMSN
jgi:RHS repeat-associated protein